MEKPEERNFRINKVLRELNVSLERAVDYLKDEGIIIEASPNTTITQSEYYLLRNEFGNKPIQIEKIQKICQITLSKLIGRKDILVESNRNTYCLNNENKITGLNLGKNKISNLTMLDGLIDLEELYLADNEIEDFSVIKNLKKLTRLNLGSNSVSDLTPLIELIELKELYLYNNQIVDLKALIELKSLTTLHLSNNKIIDIKPLGELNKLTSLILNANPFLDIIELKLEPYTNHLNDIKSYLSRQAETNKKEVVYPVKILMLGNSNSGKSTFVDYFIKNENNRIINEDLESTHILQIHQYRKNSNIHNLPQAILFDFGGQDYYHGVYKAFLTNNAINIMFWKKTQDTNAIVPDRNNNELMTQNFSRNYWIHQLNYYFPKFHDIDKQSENSNTTQTQINFLVQTHADKDKRDNYIGNCENLQIENEFYIALNNEAIKTKKSLINLEYFERILIETIYEKQKKNEEPEWYSDFLQYILNYDEATAVKLVDLKKVYNKSKEGKKYLETDLLQLSQQGLILYYPNNDFLKNFVWLNPTLTIKQIHDEVLNKNIILDNNGKVKKKDFEKLAELNIIQILVQNKVIFLDQTDTDQPFYIIPGYLPLAKQDFKEYFIFSDFEDINFILKFQNFIPFGFINQLICKYGTNPEKKLYWRDQLLFTSKNKEAKVLISLDFNNLEIKVTIKAKNSKVIVDEIEREIFEDIVQIYWGEEVLKAPSNLISETKFKLIDAQKIYTYSNNKRPKREYGYLMTEEFANEYLTNGTPDELENRKKEFLILPKTSKEIELENRKNIYSKSPDDMYLSIDNKTFIHHKTLEDIALTSTKIISYGTDKKTEKQAENEVEIRTINKNKTKEQSSGLYKNFTKNENIKEMKKIFISYSKSDLTLVNEFQDHLSSLKLDNVISSWYCTELIAGGEWDQEIQQKFNEADIVCFMISSNLMRTDYIHKYEIAKAFERKEKDSKFRIVPIILDFCSWRTQKNNLGDFTALPYTAKPVCDFKNKNMAWFIIVECIKFMIDSDSQPEGDDWFNKPTLPVNIRKLYERIVEGRVDDNSNG